MKAPEVYRVSVAAEPGTEYDYVPSTFGDELEAYRFAAALAMALPDNDATVEGVRIRGHDGQAFVIPVSQLRFLWQVLYR